MTTEARLRTALERIANSEIPGVSGGPHGPSAQVMEFAAQALASASECPVCGGRGWHTAGGNDPAACGRCPAGAAFAGSEQSDIHQRVRNEAVAVIDTERQRLAYAYEETASVPVRESIARRVCYLGQLIDRLIGWRDG